MFAVSLLVPRTSAQSDNLLSVVIIRAVIHSYKATATRYIRLYFNSTSDKIAINYIFSLNEYETDQRIYRISRQAWYELARGN